MARTEVFEQIYGTLRQDQTLLALLGNVTPMNQRLYRSWPQLVNFLSTYQPQPAEGWLVFHEEAQMMTGMSLGYEHIYEILEPLFSVVATTFTLADYVIDYLDATWQWSIPQQRAVQYGERILLFSRRYLTQEKFEGEIKLPNKSWRYRMSFVLECQPA